jgi:hypothetical protein
MKISASLDTTSDNKTYFFKYKVDYLEVARTYIIISFEDFIKIYYKSKHIEPYLINPEAGETDDSEENEKEEDSSLISDDISLITDD